jgi:hypothetical protein
MSTAYRIASTSSKSADVEDIWLEPPDDHSTALTRRVLRPQIVDNVHSDKERVRACIIHQKRHSKNLPWEDVDAFNLATMKAGEEVRLHLSCAETFQIYEELSRLYTISEDGVPKGHQKLEVVNQSEAVVVHGPARGVLKKLLDQAGDEVWKTLNELQPHLFKATALVKLHQLREQAVHDFSKHLNANDWNEGAWQRFFEENTWIFGYGLSYRFLSAFQAQPQYGGANLSGQGGQRGDFLMITEAEKRYTVLVEIKKPASLLLHERPYREGAYRVADELAGGVSQIQANCRTMETIAATLPTNADMLEERDAYTVQPKGILIIGRTSQLDNRTKRTSFELFRQNLKNPEIITFDELLERSKHLLINDQKQNEPPVEPDDDDDIPF